jgi:hypothetical protein
MRIEAAGGRLVQVASFEAKERTLQPKWRGSGETVRGRHRTERRIKLVEG